MENQKDLKPIKESENGVNLKIVQIIYFCIFLIMYSSNIVILLILFTIVPNLELPFLHWILLEYGRFVYILIIVFAFISIIIGFYELIRFILYLRSSTRNKKSLNTIVLGEIWAKIAKKTYLVFLFILILLLKTLQLVSLGYLSSASPQYPNWGTSEFIIFHNLFTPIIYIQIFFIALTPHFMRFTMKPKEREPLIKVLVYPTVWIVVLLFLFFFNYALSFGMYS